MINIHFISFRTLLLAMIMLAFSTSVYSHSVKPADNQDLLKLREQLEELENKISAVETESEAKTIADMLLASANQPGKSQYYLMAEKLIRPYVDSSNDPDVWYMWAKIQQHEHRFDLSKKQLSRILEVKPNDVPAHLMAARLGLIERDLSIAKKHCQLTIGHVDILTTSICLIEVDSYQGDLKNNYKKLVSLVAKKPLPNTHRNWVALMLADMALRSNDLVAASHHLNQFTNFNDISYLTTWADVKLATGEENLVLKKLHDLYDTGVPLEDGLLLRLAVAELQKNNRNNTFSHIWKDKLIERLEFRFKRDETMHANEMARYYLSINPKPEEALHWAKLNWEKSKEHQDEILLKEAQQQTIAAKN